MFERTRFLGLFAKAKGDEIGADFTAFCVNLNPTTASKAELDLIQQHLNEIDGKLSLAEQTAEREHKETVAAQALVDQYLAAADLLTAQVAAGTAQQKSLDTLLATLDKAVATLDSDKAEDAAAQAFVAQLRQTHDMMADKLNTANGQLKDAVRSLEQAKLQQERAEERGRDAQIAAGLAASGGKLNIALDAINAKADQAKVAARAAELSADAIRPTSALDGDPAIAAALAAVQRPQASQSPADRLAALRQRAAG